MNENGIVIVDDSPFSIAMLRNILEDNGFTVVGEASSLEGVKEVVAKSNPALVTMDMTLPGTDGFECTRAIHKINENIKVIVVSSMMDDEIVKEAKKNNVSAYIQKPVDPDELIIAVKRIVNSDELYRFLEDTHCSIFKESLLDCFNKMTKTLITYDAEYPQEKEFTSKGISIIVGIIGEFPGRMLIDLSKETATNLVSAVLRREPMDHNEVLLALGEFANIISGNASSILNRKNKALGLRVAPPSILRGEKVVISPPNFTTTTVLAKTDFGEIFLNVGFKRSVTNWM
ncbi:MAG TPA: response regulator [Epulopiscium sp.]|nr:response regulator [Candidatus Epulonipiscium sp.]